MTQEEIKVFIAEKTQAGHSLSQIQDMLSEQGVRMTFMELRLIASEMDQSIWKKNEAEKKEQPAQKASEPCQTETPESAANEQTDENDFPGQNDSLQNDNSENEESLPQRGNTSITIDQLQRPGFLATGTVQFGSGAHGNWLLDQMGRLMFDKLEGNPDRQDVQEFQLELQRAFAN